MQADTIDEAVQYLHHSIEHESLGREIELDAAILKPAEPIANLVPAAEPAQDVNSRIV